MHDGMLYGRNQGQGQGHSWEVDRQSPTGLIFIIIITIIIIITVWLCRLDVRENGRQKVCVRGLLENRVYHAKSLVEVITFPVSLSPLVCLHTARRHARTHAHVLHCN